MAQRDLVLRWIAQAARVVARMLGRRGPGDLELARGAIDEAMQSLLGHLALVMPSLDAVTAVSLLREPERVHGYAWLLGLQAALSRAAGDEAEAGRLEARSEACYRAAVQADPTLASVWSPNDTGGASPA